MDSDSSAAPQDDSRLRASDRRSTPEGLAAASWLPPRRAFDQCVARPPLRPAGLAGSRRRHDERQADDVVVVAIARVDGKSQGPVGAIVGLAGFDLAPALGRLGVVAEI